MTVRLPVLALLDGVGQSRTCPFIGGEAVKVADSGRCPVEQSSRRLFQVFEWSVHSAPFSTRRALYMIYAGGHVGRLSSPAKTPTKSRGVEGRATPLRCGRANLVALGERVT